MANDYLGLLLNPSLKAIPDKVGGPDLRCHSRRDLSARPRRAWRLKPCNTGLVVLAGEITTNANVDYIQVARDTIKRIGYDNTEYGIDYKVVPCWWPTTSNPTISPKAWTTLRTTT